MTNVKQIDLEPNEWSVVRKEDAPAPDEAYEPVIAPGGWGVLSFWFCLIGILWLAVQVIAPLVDTFFATPLVDALCSAAVIDCEEVAAPTAQPPAPTPRP